MHDTIKHILVPIDGSADAVKAAVMAGILARSAGARITLVHVFDTHSMPMGGASALSREELARATNEAAERAFGGAREALAGGSTEYATITLHGEPGPEIVRHAAEQDVDLVVMGSRGRSPLGQMLLGSISSHVLQHAPCSVTVAR